MNADRMSEREWRMYLRTVDWKCYPCGADQRGLAEPEMGRLVGTCKQCARHTLVFLWGDTGWIDAQLNGIVLEQD